MTNSYAQRIERVTAHIRTNLAGDLSLDALAEIAALSRFHFHQVFAAMTGETVADFVRRARMNRAVVLVAMSDRSLASVAPGVGYPNQDSFARAFRGAFGATPRQIRDARRVAPLLLPPPKGVPSMFPVDVRTLPAMSAAALLHRGPYDKIGKTFSDLARQLAKSPLAGKTREAVGLYYDMPGQVPDAELRAHAGCIVEPGAEVPAAFDDVHLTGGRHAVLTVKGSYVQIPEAWTYLYGTWLPGSGFAPADRAPFELYVNEMGAVPEAELITLICLPLAD